MVETITKNKCLFYVYIDLDWAPTWVFCVICCHQTTPLLLSRAGFSLHFTQVNNTRGCSSTHYLFFQCFYLGYLGPHGSSKHFTNIVCRYDGCTCKYGILNFTLIIPKFCLGGASITNTLVMFSESNSSSNFMVKSFFKRVTLKFNSIALHLAVHCSLCKTRIDKLYKKNQSKFMEESENSFYWHFLASHRKDESLKLMKHKINTKRKLTQFVENLQHLAGIPSKNRIYALLRGIKAKFETLRLFCASAIFWIR